MVTSPGKWKQKAWRLAHIRPTLRTDGGESLGPIHLSPRPLLGDGGGRGKEVPVLTDFTCKPVGNKERKQELMEQLPLLLASLTGATAVRHKAISKGGTMPGNPSFQKESNPTELHHVA